MKDFLIAGMIVFLAAMPVRMYGKEIDKGKLEKVKDYVNSRITYLFLEAYVKKDQKSLVNFESVKAALQTKDVQSAKAVAELRTILANKFGRTIQKLVDPINDIDVSAFASLSNDEAAEKIVDEAFAILAEKYTGEFYFLQEQKEFLIMAIVNFLGQRGDAGGKNPGGRTDSIVVDKGKVHDDVVPQKAGFFNADHFSIWILLLFLGMVGLLFYFMREIKYLRKRLHKLTTDNATAASSKEKEPWYNKSSSGALSMKDLENAVLNSTAVQSLVDDINIIKSMLEKKNSSNPVNISPVEQTTGIRENNREEVFYMAGPVNYYFPLSAKSTTKENTVYKFTVKVNKSEAVYELHTSGAPVQEILTMVESYIRPACDEENLPGDVVRNIVTKTKGIAILEGDRWMIKTKAIIRYE